MKRIRASDISSIDAGSQGYFFDTSVLFYTNGPSIDPNDQNTADYSNVIKFLLENDKPIYITDGILSEFHSLALKYFHRSYNNHINIKKYKQTQDYRENLSTIIELTRSAKNTCHSISFDQNVIFPRVEGVFLEGKLDFTDAVTQVICEMHDLALITHDSDFSQSDLTIITANDRFFT